MKLVFILGAKHFDNEIKKIFDEAEISIYSQTDISGHNKNEEEVLQDNWFALSNDHQKSIVFFSFTEEYKAVKALNLANTFNRYISSKSRIRVFIMPVESHN